MCSSNPSSLLLFGRVGSPLLLFVFLVGLSARGTVSAPAHSSFVGRAAGDVKDNGARLQDNRQRCARDGAATSSASRLSPSPSFRGGIWSFRFPAAVPSLSARWRCYQSRGAVAFASLCPFARVPCWFPVLRYFLVSSRFGTTWPREHDARLPKTKNRAFYLRMYATASEVIKCDRLAFLVFLRTVDFFLSNTPC